MSSSSDAIKWQALMRAIMATVILLLGTAVSPISWGGEFLAQEKASLINVRMSDPNTAEANFRMARGYYMFGEGLAFKAEGGKLCQAVIPKGLIKFDDTVPKDVESPQGSLSITLPVKAAGPGYPPMESLARLSPAGGNSLVAPGGLQNTLFSPAPGDATFSGSNSEMGRIEASLQSGRLLIIVPLFLLLGLGLSFTPCVLPMVPILSSIIIGDGARVSRGRGFALSLAYSGGMALVYTGLGVAAGLAGEGLAAALQAPWALASFAILMVALSLSMFGVYQLQVPVALQARLMRASDRRSTGRMLGVFAMGAISALIVGPCVAAPLAGALIFISQTRDVVIGASALFAMAVGMSVPLLLIGLSAGALLPRAGPWMDALKTFFGVVMLALAVWIIAPVMPSWGTMVGWAAIGMVYGAYLLRGRWGWMSKAVGALFLALGIMQLAGMASGGRDALAPLAHLTGSEHKTDFQRVRSVAELDAMLLQANGRTVMLDFYADWCVSCIEMEKLTFSDARVRKQFAEMLLLQADVTANNEDDKALLRRFKLFGPPGIIFFDGQGREIAGGRVIGYQNADKFLNAVKLARSF